MTDERTVTTGETAALLCSQESVAALRAEIERLRKALQFYADGEHFVLSEPHAWDTVSGEPPNYWCDEAGTATVEDGSLARLVLAGVVVDFDGDAQTGER